MHTFSNRPHLSAMLLMGAVVAVAVSVLLGPVWVIVGVWSALLGRDSWW